MRLAPTSAKRSLLDRAGQTEAERQDAEQVDRHHQVAWKTEGWRKARQRHVQRGGQRARQSDQRQHIENQGARPTRHDFFFREQLDDICQGLKPARPDPILEPGDQLAVNPFVDQSAQQDKQAARYDEQRHQVGRHR